MTGFFPYRIPTAVAALLAGALLVAGAACTDGAADADTFQLLVSPVNGGNGRAFHAAVPVPGSDDVLLVGGQGADANGLPLIEGDYAERFFFASRAFTFEDGLRSILGRVDPVAAQITDGVVIIGGLMTGVTVGSTAPEYLSSSTAVADGEIYLPGDGITDFTPLANGAYGAALVSDGTNLYLIGGRDDTNTPLNTIRWWNGNAFVSTGETLNDAREGHSATLLSTGDILIVGGWDIGGAPLQTAELYTPLPTNTVGATTIPLGVPRTEHTATASADGTRVLLFGGFKGVNTVLEAFETAELYTVGGTFTVVPWVAATAPTSRVYHTATLLGNGDIAIIGGITDGSILTPVADLFRPSSRLFHQSQDLLNAARFGHTATLLVDGSVLLAGGMSAPTVMISAAERYIPELP